MSGEVAVQTSQVPALLADAEQALALVENQEDAEMLWRQIQAIEHAARLAKVHGEMQLKLGKLRLRSERRWGELLGPAQVGRPENVSNGNVSSGAERVARHKARDVAAVPESTFTGYLDRVKDPEMLRRGRLLRLAREEEAERRRGQPVEQATTAGDVEIRHGDLRTVLGDLAGQVDAIVTDPPYPAEFLDEFDALGELAARLLKPGGLLVAMVGQTHLPEYLARLSLHLTYRWCGAYLTDGPATRIHGRKVGTKWKPLLIYGGTTFITQDVFSSQAYDKHHHHWGQSESGMADIVQRLTETLPIFAALFELGVEHEVVQPGSGVFVVTGEGPEYEDGASVGKVRPDRSGREWGAIGVQYEREASLGRDRLVTFMRCRRPT